MNQDEDERKRREKVFERALEKPHLLIYAEKFEFETVATGEGLFMEFHKPNKLQ